MPELEFLPEKTKKIEFGPKKMFGPGGLTLIIILVLYGGLLLFNQRLEGRVQDLDAAFLAFNQSRNKKQESRILEVKSKLEQAQTLLDEHVLWSEGFKKIQQLTLASVQLQSFAASLPELKFEFRATAPNLTTLAKQGANFLADESVSDISIGQIKILTNGRTEFVVKVIFDRDRFLR